MINKKTVYIFYSLFTICIIILSFTPCIYAKNFTTGIVLADDQGNILYSQNSTKQFIPASILKILTSLAAIQILGEDYRFPTEYSFDPGSKDLHIKGFGDPLFISEEINKFVRQINLTTKTKQIRNIIIDHTYFSNNIRIPGKGFSLNPYDASVGALCANFNTVMFKWDGRNNRFISAEPQTPLLPIFLDRIKITNLKQGRIILSEQQSRLYSGHLLQYFLKKNNIKVTGEVSEGRFDVKKGNTQEFLSSFQLTDVVQKLLEFSNNFIANQLLLTIGTAKYNEPATLEKGVKALNEFAQQNLGLDNVKNFEGSGLSTSNKISPEQMLKILFEFMPYHALLRKDKNDFYKTGTLSGVRTKAGYILGNNNRLYPYIIMINKQNQGYDKIHKKLLQMVSQITQNNT